MAVKKVEKKATNYVVLRSEDAKGPFTVVGNWETNGQIAAKKAAALEISKEGGDPETDYFVAVPASSFYPQKPTIQMVITFLSDDGTEAPEVEDEPEEEVNDEIDFDLPEQADSEPPADPELLAALKEIGEELKK